MDEIDENGNALAVNRCGANAAGFSRKLMTMGRYVCLVGCLAYSLLWLEVAIPAQAASDREHDSIGSLRQLPVEQLAERRRVRIRGTITQRLGYWFIVQDATGGIRVDFQQAQAEGVWTGVKNGPAEGRAGLGMEIEGIVVQGEIAPTVLPITAQVLGPEPLPPPRPVDDARLFSGADDCERVEVTGVVHAAAAMPSGTIRIVIDRNGRRFEAWVEPAALSAPAEDLVDSVVRVVGPVNSFLNTRRELVLAKMWVFNPENISVVEPRRAPPFETELVPLERLAWFRPEPLRGHMIRVRGMATHAAPGSLVYLQSGAIGVRVETASREPIKPGDVVEAAGFIDRPGDAFVHGLDDAVVRVISTGPPPQPADIGPDAILALNHYARNHDVPAEPGDYDGALVRFPARLVEASSSPDGGELILSTGTLIVPGLLSQPTLARLSSLEPETELLVTGIVRLTWAPDPATGQQRRPTAFTLLIRGPEDVAVLRPAPFWTRRRLLMAVGLVAASLVAAMLWVWLLRRQVAGQVVLIKEQLRHEAVADERRRIAREFHDSLEQGLAGMAMRLDAAARRLETGVACDIVRQHRALVGRLQGETRDFLQDLREPPGSATDLASGLEAMLASFEPLGNARIVLDLQAANLAVAPACRHDALRIVREAVTNALRHASPTVVTVSARREVDALRITVADDGTGFDIASRAAVPGHYGIRGMQERAERIGGRIEITSAPRGGTRVEMTVPAVASTTKKDDSK